MFFPTKQSLIIGRLLRQSQERLAATLSFEQNGYVNPEGVLWFFQANPCHPFGIWDLYAIFYNPTIPSGL